MSSARRTSRAGGGGAAPDPPVGDGRRALASELRIVAVEVGEDEARRVPELVGEVPVALDALLGEANVPPLGGHRGQGEAERVGAELIHDGERIHHVALRLRHLPPFRVAHEGVDVDVVEGHLAHHLEPEHRHPRHPEEDDVEAGDEDRGRVEGLELGGGVGPAERGERPEPGREPRVEHVRILAQRAPALRAGGQVRARDVHLAVLVAVPGGDAVAPPELARDGPVAELLHPIGSRSWPSRAG